MANLRRIKIYPLNNFNKFIFRDGIIIVRLHATLEFSKIEEKSIILEETVGFSVA